MMLFAVQSLNKLSEQKPLKENEWWIPVSDIPLMHELDTLDEQLFINQHDARR